MYYLSSWLCAYVDLKKFIWGISLVYLYVVLPFFMVVRGENRLGRARLCKA